MKTRVALALAGLLASGSPLEGQISRALSAGIGASQVRYALDVPAGVQERLSGVAVGGRAALAAGRLALEASYLQARLLPDSGSPPSRDLVEGTLLLAVRPVSWLSLRGGVHVLATVTPSLTRRWVLGEARARIEGPLVGSTAGTHLEFRRALSATVNAGQGSTAAQGGEVGLTVRLARAPIWARLTYSIDRATVGARSETLETVGIAAGFGGR